MVAVTLEGQRRGVSMTTVDDANANAAALHRKLRVETAAMLNLDLTALSPTDGLRLDLTALLRLQLDSLQGLALAGQDVDMSRLSACVAMLQKMMPTSLSPAIPEPDFSGAAEQFARLIAQRASSLKARRDFLHEQEIERLHSQLAARDATIARLTAATPQVVADTPPAALSPAAQTSSQPALHASSSPYVRRGGDVVAGRFGPKDWSNRN
jgi:hypothetical protein